MTPATTTVRVRLELLGGFALVDRDGHVPLPPAGQRLLTYLAVQRRPAVRTAVAAALWPEGSDAQAGANLRSTLRRLPRPDDVALVTAGPTHLRLPPWIGVDYWDVQDLLTGLASGAPADAADLALLECDLLPDVDTEWLEIEREHHRQRRLHALERLCRRHREAGDLEQAITVGLAAIGSEPLRESAHRELIEVHLAEGNHAEALRQYQAYRHRLRDQLGLSPSPAIRSLVAPLLGRPADAARAGHPPPTSRRSRRSGSVG